MLPASSKRNSTSKKRGGDTDLVNKTAVPNACPLYYNKYRATVPPSSDVYTQSLSVRRLMKWENTFSQPGYVVEPPGLMDLSWSSEKAEPNPCVMRTPAACFCYCFMPVSMLHILNLPLAVLINIERKTEVGDPLGGKVIEFSATGCQVSLKSSFITPINYGDHSTKIAIRMFKNTY